MATEPIDANEIVGEEIPAELLDRVSENHPNMYEVLLQVRRAGRWSTMQRGKKTWSKTPPELSSYDIAVHLVRLALQDIEVNGEGQRYRARFRCRVGTAEYSRFATVRGVLDERGAIAIVDDGAGVEADPLRVMLEAKQQSDAVSFKCLDEIRKTVEKFGGIADAFTSMLVAAGDVYSKNVGDRASLLKVQIELEQNQHMHAQTMAKYERGFNLLEGPVSRVGDEIVETLLDAMRQKRGAKGKPNGRPRPSGASQPCGFASSLDGVFTAAGAANLKAAEDYMSPDEWKLLQAARTAATEQEFDHLFERFYVELRKRDHGDPNGTTTWIAKMKELLGEQGMYKIGMLIQRLEKARRAKQEQQQQPPPQAGA